MTTFYGFQRIVRRFARDRRGSAELNTYLLLCAAGCVMVGVTAPSLYHSSEIATRTFEEQVRVLEGGADPGGRGGFNLPDFSSFGSAGGGGGGVSSAREQPKSEPPKTEPPKTEPPPPDGTLDRVRQFLKI